MLDIELSYDNLIKALRTKVGLTGTIEVDPSYGKYHYDGHRICKVCLSPKESLKLKDICPKCGRKLTIGVAHRVEELADREEGFRPKDAKEFYSLIPLSEIISNLNGFGIATQKTWKIFNDLMNEFGSELDVLLESDFEKIKKVTDEKLAKAIMDNRGGKIKIKPGYDGEYGVPVFGDEITKEEQKIDVKVKQKGLGEFI